MAEHAKNSPSSAERWFTCPGSQVLSLGYEQKSSSYADEGTAAHALAEAMLRGAPSIGKAEMRDSLRVYVDHVKELASAEPSTLHVETQVKVTDECWGTADAIVWGHNTKTLYVVDLKYGAGIGVEARGNLQLKIYALAALLTMRYPAKTVVVGVAQPRYAHPNGPIRSVDYDAVDLVEFHADLLDAEKRVEAAAQWGDLYPKWRKSPKPVDVAAADDWEAKYLTPSEKGCRWCLAAPTCPKLANKAQEMAKQVFTVATVGDGSVRSYDPKQLAAALDFLPILEAWIENVREFAYQEAEQGHTIPSYKLVEKRASRKWNGDEDAIADVLIKEGVSPWTKKLIGVTDAEKALGKANASILAALTVKESSGHVLAHESDKRPAVRIDAKSVFDILS